eukprot:COSAG02_NODE_8347_length_2603_cov_1.735224_3_plen_142_part_00
MRDELEELSHETKKGDQVIGVDEYLDYMLSKWCAMVNSQKEQLVILFKEVDDDGDRQLSLAEFSRVVDAVIPAISQTEVLELYKSCLARSAEIRQASKGDNDDDDDHGGNMDAIVLDAFLVVMLPHLVAMQSAADGYRSSG